jgi:hypothetical protein
LGKVAKWDRIIVGDVLPVFVKQSTQSYGRKFQPQATRPDCPESPDHCDPGQSGRACCGISVAVCGAEHPTVTTHEFPTGLWVPTAEGSRLAVVAQQQPDGQEGRWRCATWLGRFNLCLLGCQAPWLRCLFNSQ